MCCHRNKTGAGIDRGLGCHGGSTCHSLVAADNQHMAVVIFVPIPVSDGQFPNLLLITQHAHTGFDCIKDSSRHRKVRKIKFTHHLWTIIRQQAEFSANKSDGHVRLNACTQNVARIGAQAGRKIYRKHITFLQVNC